MKALAGLGLLIASVLFSVAAIGFATRLLAEALLFGWGLVG